MAEIATIVMNSLLIMAGLVGGYVSRVLFQRRIKPVLKSTDQIYSIPTSGVFTEQEQPEERQIHTPRETFFLEVVNRGRNSAKNVKAHLVLKGTTRLDDTLPELTLSLRTPLRWSEADRPSSTEINPDETLGLEIMNIQYRDFSVSSSNTAAENELHIASYVQVPAEEEPVKNSLAHGERFEPPQFAISAKSGESLPRAIHSLTWNPEKFSNINWGTALVEITAANADKLEQNLVIGYEDDEFKLMAGNMVLGTRPGSLVEV